MREDTTISSRKPALRDELSALVREGAFKEERKGCSSLPSVRHRRSSEIFHVKKGRIAGLLRSDEKQFNANNNF